MDRASTRRGIWAANGFVRLLQASCVAAAACGPFYPKTGDIVETPERLRKLASAAFVCDALPQMVTVDVGLYRVDSQCGEYAVFEHDFRSNRWWSVSPIRQLPMSCTSRGHLRPADCSKAMPE